MLYENLPDPKQQSDGSWAVQYEVKDEAGKVVSRTTLTGPTEKSVWKKLQAAHAEASATIVRLRNRQIVAKPGTLGGPEEEALNARIAATLAEEERQSYIFLSRHAYAQDYNNCTANNTVLRDYLERLGHPWTADNLEIVFEKATADGALAPPVAVQIEESAEPPAKPAGIPAEFDRRAILKLPKDEFKAFLKRWGKVAVDARLNGWD